MKVIYKIIYHPFFNKILLKFNSILFSLFPKIVRLNPSGKYKFRFSNNDFIILNTNQTSYLTHVLYWNGIEEFEYSNIFIELIKKVNTFYDIGSNIGYYSILGAKVNSSLKVEAFEPSPGVLKYLVKNIRDNHFESRINCNSIALSDKKSQLVFNEIHNSKYPEISNLSGEHNLETKSLNSRKILVESDTLDNFYKQNESQIVDLIKIDTEGTEDLILKNGSYLIDKFKPIIICETLFNTIEERLENIMISHGYEFYNHKENYLEKISSIKRTYDNGARNCFFVHSSKKHLIEEFLLKK